MVDLSKKKIFISYNNRDQKTAQKVGGWIDSNDGFKSHIVGIGDSDLKDGISLTDMLLENIAFCQQIMAVVSINTVKSWWVPWEIGVGSERRLVISSYIIDDNFSESILSSLPEYIKMNPILGTKDDVDAYCDTQSHLLTESLIGKREKGSKAEEVALFRTTLKRKLKSRRGF